MPSSDSDPIEEGIEETVAGSENSVPASSAGIERVFSLASIVQGGRRFRLGAGSTEAELMIKVNRSFLTEEHV